MTFWVVYIICLTVYAIGLSYLYIKIALAIMQLIEAAKPEIKRRKEISVFEKLNKNLNKIRKKKQKSEKKAPSLSEDKEKEGVETW